MALEASIRQDSGYFNLYLCALFHQRADFHAGHGREVLSHHLTIDRAQLAQDYDSARLGRFARYVIGFQMALQVRNRVVQAYSEVMSMQV